MQPFKCIIRQGLEFSPRSRHLPLLHCLSTSRHRTFVASRLYALPQAYNYHEDERGQPLYRYRCKFLVPPLVIRLPIVKKIDIVFKPSIICVVCKGIAK
jgi:hypothetical protein